ncbi:MAG: ribonuclease D [Planctomycetaceae bacterium]|nr:MAG: ribonuclease D [Planctomycetaceae bacterium]
MKYEIISTAADLEDLCDRLAEKSVIGFDTEFVSEDRYRPQLCLIQVAAGEIVAVIDPLKIEDTTPFWELLSEPGRTVVAHAAREEIRFCYRHSGRAIGGLFDTQLAAGFIGGEYPASLSNLALKLLGVKLSKGETRTNWRTRPLTQAQLNYAVRDVTELEAMHRILRDAVSEAGRLGWLEEETEVNQQAIHQSENRENWHRVSGATGLTPRQGEIVRQLWRWRDQRAREVDRPAKWVFRDDLIVEVARSGSDDPRVIRGIRGMEFRHFHDHYDDLAAAVRRALETPDCDLPRRERGRSKRAAPMLAQFLNTSIACVCRQHQIAPMIVGNTDDVRDLIEYELDGGREGEQPALLRGWRGRIVGEAFRRLLRGELAIRVADPYAAQPLEFVASDGTAAPTPTAGRG